MLTSNTEPVLTAEPRPCASALGLSAAREPWTSTGRRFLASYGTLIRTVAVSFLVFALTAVQGILLARLLGPKARGEYSAVMLYSQTLLFIGMLGAPLTIARRAARRDCALPLLRNAAMRYGLCTGIATACVVVLLSFFALPVEKRYLAPWCGLATLIMPIEHMRLAVMSVEHGRASFRRYNYFRLSAQAALPGLLAILMLSGGASLGLVVVMTILAPLIGLALQLVATPGARPWKPVDPRPSVLAREGLPYAAEGLVGQLYGRLDMLLVLWLVSDLSVQGQYAAAVPAAGLIIVAGSALDLFAFNAGARATAPMGRKKLMILGGAVALLQLVSAGVLYLLLEPVILFVYGEKFREAVPFALALLPAFALGGCGMVAEGYLRGRGRPGASMRANAVAVVVMLIGVSVWFPSYHVMSIPWASGLGRLVGLACLLVAVALDAPAQESGTAPEAKAGAA